MKNKTQKKQIQKVLVCSGVGRQGKSTLSRHLFPDWNKVAWDTVNFDYHDQNVPRAKNASDFGSKVISAKENTVFDVGASEWQNLVSKLNEFAFIFTKIILVVRPEDSEDAVSGLKTLFAVPGIDKNRIAVIVNAVDTKSLASKLKPLINFTESSNFKINVNAVVPYAELLQRLNRSSETLFEVASRKEAVLDEVKKASGNISEKEGVLLNAKLEQAVEAHELWTHVLSLRKELAIPYTAR